MHRSGTASLDGTWCGRDAARAPASRKRSDWLAGVSRRATATVGVSSSADEFDGDVPTGLVAVWVSSNDESSTMLSSEGVSWLSTAAHIDSSRGVVEGPDGWLEGTSKSLKTSWSCFTAAVKNRLSGANYGALRDNICVM